MKTTKLAIPVLLPEATNEKNRCIQRLVELVAKEKGITNVELKEQPSAKIFIHYNPELISVKKIRHLAQQHGAKMNDQYAHEVFELKGFRNVRHARSTEADLTKVEGIISASANLSGQLKLEWDNDIISRAALLREIGKRQLNHRHSLTPGPKQNDTSDTSTSHFFGHKLELFFALLSGVFWLTGLLLSIFELAPTKVYVPLFIVSMLFGGYYTFRSAGKELLKGKLEIDFLMLFAAIGAAALGRWGEGALLLFLFSLGHALEHYAMDRAKKSITALADLAPPVALLKNEDELQEVPIETLRIGDIILVKPNSKIAADGVVIKGSSAVNQAPITGESVPVDKVAHPHPAKSSNLEKLDAAHRVFAGTINGSGVLEIKVLKAASDSTLTRLITLVKEAETQKSPTQHLTDKFEKYYVPAVLIVVTLLMMAFLVIDESFEQSFYRAMSVLIAASPCALAISTPSAVLAGIARAARQGVLVKGGRPLEDLGKLTSIAFDKTGTLTEGKPKLTNAIPYGNTSKAQLLQVAVAVESLSDHPLAAAIVAGGKEALQKMGISDIPEASQLEALTARGVRANWQNSTVFLGNRRLLEERTGEAVPAAIDQIMSDLEDKGNTAMIVFQDQQYLGVISVMDVARPEARSTLAALKEIGIQRMIMLTGDHQKVADAIAADIGITDPLGSLLPEDKVAAIEKLKEEGGVAMVGDGVNDAPAMAKSTVGIAMG
ncbi:MAG: heavy metal translocating P-type ATPase, partial [Bacteroidota bacterium]